MMVTLSEIKNNPQETNREGKEVGIQTNNLEHKEEINIQPKCKGETRIQKNKDRLRNLWDISRCASIRIIGMPGGKEAGQEVENLFEKIMKENVSNLVKEIRHTSPGSTESPKQIGPIEGNTKTQHN